MLNGEERDKLRLDSNLSSLASTAAIEFDNLLLGKESDLQAATTLAERLRNSFEPNNGVGTPKSLMDPATLTILGEAAIKSNFQPNIVDVSDLISHALSIADNLTDKEQDEDRLKWARTFCLALSKCAEAYRRSIYDLRPSHPFRR
jgi:hypothetical protein